MRKRRRNSREYNAHLNSDKWKAIAEQTQKRDGYRCRDCGTQAHLHVHHLTYDRFGNELLQDLKTLCKECHAKEHRRLRALKRARTRKQPARRVASRPVKPPPQKKKIRKYKPSLTEENEQLHQTLAANRERRARRVDLATWQ